MPAIPQALAQLMVQKVAANIQAVSGTSPLATKASPYFTNFFTAIATGIAQGTPTMQFKTADAGFIGIPPVPGVGTGVGVEVDASDMSEKMYTYLRTSIIAKYGSTLHEAWPPSKDNSGQYMKAMTDGIAAAVKEHYKVCWILTSNHLTVYAGTGVIDPTKSTDESSRKNFTGISSSAVKSLILSNAGLLKGPYLADFADCIARGYKDGIEQKAKGEVTIIGICIPLVPPAGVQACNIPGSGEGTGVAS